MKTCGCQPLWAACAAGTAVYCAGLEAHSLPLLYASYAALSGSAFGLVYGSVVPTVQKWFPDRKGVASSVCAAAFGTGAFVWAPIYTKLLEAFRSAPAAAYGAATRTVDGVRYAEVAPGDWREAVLATAADLAAAGQPALEPGLFLVGSGNTGVVEAVSSRQGRGRSDRVAAIGSQEVRARWKVNPGPSPNPDPKANPNPNP